MKKIIVIATFLLFHFGIATEVFANGWFLMVPPLHEAELQALYADQNFLELPIDAKVAAIRRYIRKDAPLHEWEQVAAYDSAADCEAGKKRRIEDHEKNMHELSQDKSKGSAGIGPLLPSFIKTLTGRCVPTAVVFPPPH